MKRTIRTIALLVAATLAGAAQAQEIKVGGVFDITGLTADVGKPFAGGLAFETPFGRIYSANITPDDATGIGRWSLRERDRVGNREQEKKQ